MGLKVYGSRESTCTGRVLACAAEIGVELELVPVNLATGEHKRAPHIERNPFGQIPALEDGDLVLFGYTVVIWINSGTFPSSSNFALSSKRGSSSRASQPVVCSSGGGSAALEL